MPDREYGESGFQVPPVTLQGRHFCVAAPLDFAEACFSVSAVRALHNFSPEAQIVVLCPVNQLALWQRGLPEVDSVLGYRRGASAASIASILKACDVEFESAIVWEAGNAAAALKKTGVAQRVGYSLPHLEKWLTDTVPMIERPGPVEHRVRYYLGLIKLLGANAFVRSSFETPPLPPPPEEIRIALAPLSEYGPSYQWPVARFVELINAVNERYAGVCWTIFDRQDGRSGAEGLEVFEDLLDHGDTETSEHWEREGFFDQLAACSVLLACDGELPHMAAHIGLPTTVIFGPNSPEWKRPVSKASVVVREHVACSPCYMKRCPLDHRCQNEVTVKMVMDGLERAIRMRYESAPA